MKPYEIFTGIMFGIGLCALVLHGLGALFY